MEENNQVWMTADAADISTIVDLITLTEFAAGAFIKTIIDL